MLAADDETAAFCHEDIMSVSTQCADEKQSLEAF